LTTPRALCLATFMDTALTSASRNLRVARTRARTGRAYPLGAGWDGKGVNFAVHAGSAATAVLLCLFDAAGNETQRIALSQRRGSIWYGYVPGLGPGALYGWRVVGPYDPGAGQRFNAHKLLLDPYAHALAGVPQWSSAHYGYVPGEGEEGFEDLSCSLEDSAPVSPRCVVVDERFDWGDSAPPRTPWSRSVIYEVHVKGFTQQHPGVPQALRGTYAGLASPAAIEHLLKLGVTAVELLPIHAFFDDHRLDGLGLANYWGYNTIGFFAPEQRYSADRSPGGAVREFKQMVRTLHEAGLEVILDVVYNHTAEGNHLGPTLSFKGLDHAGYYRLSREDRRYCVDYTGTGNTLDSAHPLVVRMIVDSLRHWVSEMQVDGFRFDLATTLGRGRVHFDPRGAFFSAIANDPVLSDVKLIAEPWDLGPDGYKVGGFPAGWAEWNGVYRDAVRSFWCQREGHLKDFVQRLCGSADLYQHAGRPPTDSVNLVTVHDGFTLRDLVSYNHKHNEANGEDNRDGENHNRGWNCGAEGPSSDELVQVLRERTQRNLLATLLLSLGTPLLLGGDEIGRTQQGNNNGYCQDGPLSWFDWTPTPESQRLLAFTTRLLALRRELPALRRTRHFSGQPGADGLKDITWLLPDGQELDDERWADPGLAAVAAWIPGGAAHPDAVEDTGETQQGGGASALLVVNASADAIEFALPPSAGHAGPWTVRIDTALHGGIAQDDGAQRPAGSVVAAGRSLLLLTQALPDDDGVGPAGKAEASDAASA
jgi:isoamylase